ncbi:ribonuclease P protein component [Fibrella aestuarina BUZ 2]|uniref:Ribonuclease P protein component n=1 Tax=Fibrella aestuarina BUZ 2 TaxID=1166018 RepID=I0K3Z6_9BACT|nr:ribonuclease P protein component [Fibrella aestuarina]CCG98849.1 ribonuclease P protein component [Fibrella aestuarina BUZ 2]
MPNTFPKTERLTSKKLINRLFDRSAQTGADAVQSVYAHPFRVMFVLPGLAPATNVPDAVDVRAVDSAEANEVTTNVPEVVPKPSPQALPQVLFSVPKRAFKKAVDRNLVRRRCREAYRLNKCILQKAAVSPVAITFLYTAKVKISFDEIDKGMKLALKRMNNVR